MKWEDSCRIARARVLVLHAMLDAGFQPTLGQVKRALQPVLGDLVPVDVAGRGDQGRPRAANGRFLDRLTSTGSRVLMPSPPGRPDRTAAVDNETH